MKYVVILLLVCVAFATAAPQLLTTWPGYGGIVAPAVAPYGRTLVAGPTVVNGLAGRYIAPGYVGTYY
ncbi:uncharacterized protein LOC114352855 [Ostrinia furnacalis]|uniref:uncharacterized protein LOC114352855 n=1 Tax=Ostrinia furnacalis TaxID=93504 RepID=UPI00103DD197|nr:uncharacterized protein LOC114352855 [Ostrinia furnacalis]